MYRHQPHVKGAAVALLAVLVVGCSSAAATTPIAPLDTNVPLNSGIRNCRSVHRSATAVVRQVREYHA